MIPDRKFIHPVRSAAVFHRSHAELFENEEMDFQLLCGVRVEDDDTRLGEYLNKTQTVKKGVWTEITAECTIPGDADDLENICIAVQSSDDVAGWETGISFYLDNVSVTVESGSGEIPVTSEDPSVTAPPEQEPD